MVDDGYIRLTYEAFRQLRFVPQMTWDDNELRDELLEEGLWISRAGYCEWTAPAGLHDTRPNRMISLGWAWMEAADQQLLLVPHGIQSNVMLVSHDRMELGTSATHKMLAGWLGEQHWTAPVAAVLGQTNQVGLSHPSPRWGLV